MLVSKVFHNKNVGENVVHESLEDYRSIGKTKRHYRSFKWSVMYSKGSLPFIIISNTN